MGRGDLSHPYLGRLKPPLPYTNAPEHRTDFPNVIFGRRKLTPGLTSSINVGVKPRRGFARIGSEKNWSGQDYPSLDLIVFM